MTAQANIRILVLIGQFNSATQGEASSQLSHPSAHGKHSKDFGSLYHEGSLCRIVNSKENEWNVKCHHPDSEVFLLNIAIILTCISLAYSSSNVVPLKYLNSNLTSG